jgi:hypothetical protein
MNQVVEIADKNGNISNFMLTPKSDSTYYSEHFFGTTINFKSILPDFIYIAEDVDHWFAKNHKFQISIQSDTIKFNDYQFFYWRSEKIK